MFESPQSLPTDATPELNTTPLIERPPTARVDIDFDGTRALRLRRQSACRGSTERSAAPVVHR